MNQTPIEAVMAIVDALNTVAKELQTLSEIILAEVEHDFDTDNDV